MECTMEGNVYGSMRLRGSGPRVSMVKEEWQIVVITIFGVGFGVIFILILALYIYANKHRKEKRNSLVNRSLTEQDEIKEPIV